MSRDASVSFPEPTQWNGDDSRPMPSAGGESGPRRSDLKAALYAAVKLFGEAKVRAVLAEVVRELRT